MTFIEKNLADIEQLELMAKGDTPLHRADARIKLLTTLFFLITVVSFSKYSIAQLIPFTLYPLILVINAKLPPLFFVKKIIITSPFAIIMGIFNPLFDTTPLLHTGLFEISGGWISFFSLLIRFCLTVSTCLILISITSFHGLCYALQQLHVPPIFTTQLLFVYRYIFILLEEANRLSKAYSLRSAGVQHPPLHVYTSIIGQLLLRSTYRAERIHMAMSCRGFTGHIPMAHPTSITSRDLFFITGWGLVFIIFRLYNIPLFIGTIFTG